MDVMNIIAGDGAEDRTHAPYDTGLFAVGYGVVADYMVANVLLAPALFQSAFDSFNITSRRIS